MDAGSVSAHWKLAPEVAQRTQGIVATGFGSLSTGRVLMLRFDWKEPQRGRGAWLTALKAVAPITSAEPPRAGDRQPRSAALAISWSGLNLMALSETALASFSRPFQEGMMQEDRLRRLGDRRGGKWEPTVMAGGPLWSANTPERPPVDPLPIGFHVPDAAAVDDVIVTPVTVDAVLMLYGRDIEDINKWAAEVLVAIEPHGVKLVRDRELLLDVMGKDRFAREHFGFADGLSQPEPYDAAGHVLLGGKPRVEPHPVQGVPLGEFLFGYGNGHGEPAPGPVVPDNTGGFAKEPNPRTAGLEPHPNAEGFFDLGRNGSYMVVRELKQDVAAFWNSMEANAARIRQQDPAHLGAITAEWIAERVIGRDIDGHLLCPLRDKDGKPILDKDGKPKFPNGKLSPTQHGDPDNAFLFFEHDRHGRGCPLGSHVRRANPRDALAPDEAQRASLLGAANNHRILRRGRKFGPTIADRLTDDREDRGLLFVCLNTDIARQFEFVQQTWLLNSSFATLYKEVDPLVGPAGPMTAYVDDDPLRLIMHVETYVHLVGGDYFFLPSLPALNYLEAL